MKQSCEVYNYNGSAEVDKRIFKLEKIDFNTH
jgi:hypothetical protein